MAFGPSRFSARSTPAPLTPLTPQPSKLAALIPAWEEHVKTLHLTTCQARFARVFFAGRSTLLTGEAGTGKSYLTKALFDFLTAHRINVGKTALTGVAALQIGGQTLHSFCGVGLADEPVSNLITRIYKNRAARDRIKGVDVLFVDEISMAKGDLLDKINEVFKIVRRDNRPFGGVILCCVADFMQLMPVFRGDEVQQLAFQSEAWREANIATVILKEQMRQKTDSVLHRVLTDLRVGNTSSLHLLDDRIDAVFPNDGVDPVRVFCRNIDVDRFNAQKLDSLPGPVKTYRARDEGLPHHTEAFNKNCPAPQVLDLKVGAQVMLLVNDLDQELVNGSVGVVKAFGPDGVTVQFTNGVSSVVSHNEWQIKEQDVALDGHFRFKVVAKRRQIPLRLAWASTVHKCQGMTLDRAVIDVSDAFADNMVYTALSRVRDVESLSIAGYIPKQVVRTNRECIRFYEEAERDTAV